MQGPDDDGGLAVTKGFFDYEGRDDDKPLTYYESRVAKAKRDGTWDKPPPLVAGLPKGAATITAVQSFWMAVTWTALSVPRVVVYLVLAVTGLAPVDWANLLVALLLLGVAAYYWRSWRILLAHEAEQGKSHDHEKADRRAKVFAVIALVLVAATLVVSSIVGW